LQERRLLAAVRNDLREKVHHTAVRSIDAAGDVAGA
jgi:hypothetical protein